MMELTDYAVFLWLLPTVLQVVLPLVLACLGLGFLFLKPLRTQASEPGAKPLETSSA